MSFDALKDLLVLLQLTEQLTDSGRRPLEDALRAVTEGTGRLKAESCHGATGDAQQRNPVE